MAKETSEDILTGSTEDSTFVTGFSDKAIRRGFIRKVYSILMAQLVLTSAIVAFFMYHERSKNTLREHPEFMFFSWVVSMIFMLVILCFENARRKAPANFILLSLFTVAMSVMMAFTAAVYDSNEILIAAGITAVVCFSLTIFAFQTKWDFTMLGGALFVALIILVIFGILSAIFQNQVLNILYSALGALLFSFYLIYDTQLIIGGTHKYSISPEEYIFAALSLYLDIINLFLHILHIMRN